MTDEQETIQWRPGWYADRLHAAAGEGSSNALCGFSFPRVLPDAEWFKKKLSNEPPKCKKCARQLEKLGQLRSKTKETARPKRCRWVNDDPGCWNSWETDCNGLFQILEGTPEKNGMKFCPYCGGELLVDEVKAEEPKMCRWVLAKSSKEYYSTGCGEEFFVPNGKIQDDTCPECGGELVTDEK